MELYSCNLKMCTASAATWAAYLGLSCLLSLCSLALLFQQRGMLCLVRLTILCFSPPVCGGALASWVTLRHSGAISTIPKASLQEQDGFNAYQVRCTIMLRMWLWDCRKTCAFSQCKYVWYNIRTYIDRNTTCIQHVNVGLTQVRPNKSFLFV